MQKMDEAGRVFGSRLSTALQGEALVPGDKSISHRSIIFGSIAEGITHVEGLLEGEDVLRTMAAFQAMGVRIERTGPGALTIHGVGVDGLTEPDDVLDMGNSGTAMRLLSGLLASQPFMSILTGDSSLRGRPMGRVVKPLTQMGARILGREGNSQAPLVIQGTELIPIEYTSPHASAQIKSAVLLAALNTAGETSVTEPRLSRDHTERMLEAFGADVTRDGLTVTVDGWPDLKACDIVVPADISSAAFPLVAATLVPGSEILLPHVGVNPTRTGIIELMQAMGADIEQTNQREVGGEPVADLLVRHSPLKGINVDPALVPKAIDEFPVFCVAAALAEGETRVTEARELRVKESDRIHAMAVNLSALGVAVEELPDGLVIQGNPEGFKQGATVDSFHDHRIAMAMLVAGLRCKEPVWVTRCDNIETSFPGFLNLMQNLGAALEQQGASS